MMLTILYEMERVYIELCTIWLGMVNKGVLKIAINLFHCRIRKKKKKICRHLFCKRDGGNRRYLFKIGLDHTALLNDLEHSLCPSNLFLQCSA